MSFAQPWFLVGTLAALIPLIVHLFDRRRPRQVPFAALDDADTVLSPGLLSIVSV